LTVSAVDLDGRFPGRSHSESEAVKRLWATWAGKWGCRKVVWFFDIVE